MSREQDIIENHMNNLTLKEIITLQWWQWFHPEKFKALADKLESGMYWYFAWRDVKEGKL